MVPGVSGHPSAATALSQILDEHRERLVQLLARCEAQRAGQAAALETQNQELVSENERMRELLKGMLGQAHDRGLGSPAGEPTAPKGEAEEALAERGAGRAGIASLRLGASSMTLSSVFQQGQLEDGELFEVSEEVDSVQQQRPVGLSFRGSGSRPQSEVVSTWRTTAGGLGAEVQPATLGHASTAPSFAPAATGSSSLCSDEVLAAAVRHVEPRYSKISDRSEILVSMNRRPSRASKDSRESARLPGSARHTQGPYELTPFWVEKDALSHQSTLNTSRRASRLSVATSGHFLQRRRATTSVSTWSQLEKFVTSPVSYNRLLWEVLGVIFIVYDLIMTPLQVFQLSFGMTMLYCTLLYWTLDVPCSFFVGYHVNGVLELRVARTAVNYLRTWFCPDIIIVSIDWSVVILEMKYGSEGGSDLNPFRIIRSLRLVRFMRLLRVLKLYNFFGKLMESIHSEQILTTMHVMRLVVMILTLNHFVACGWYGIGLAFQPESWVEKFSSDDRFGYRYATSLHWSLTQFTPATMEVMPTNLGERIYSVCILVMAMVVFSSFISSITEATTHLRRMKGKQAAQYSELRQYFHENKVSMHLAVRIWRYLDHGVKIARRQRKLWRDVDMFRQLPEMLQMDLQAEVYLPILSRHPFFYQYHERNLAAMRAICHKAVVEIALVADQVLFVCGQAAERMYFLIDGNLEYVKESCERGKINTQAVIGSQWISEAALFVRWFHPGNMSAKDFSMLLALHVGTLQCILEQYVDLMPQCRKYARLFTDRLNKESEDASDIWNDFDTIQGIAQQAFEEFHDTDWSVVGSNRSSRSSRGRALLGAWWRPRSAVS